MRSFIRRKLAGLVGCSSGNATLIVALGMPMLIGGAGLGVDMAQWYMWKRELQFAVDQAAVAGAWARTDNSTKNTYQARATQEYEANLAVIENFASDPDVELADYNGGTLNSVVVEATASKSLPFSSFVTGDTVTIAASARAVVEGGTIFTTCMLALDPDADSAFILGGSVTGSVACGFGALSESDTAMVKNGNPTAKAGWLVSTGGIDEGYASNGKINAYIDGLTDPFEDLEPPASPTAQTYFCPPVSDGTTVTTADVTTYTDYDFVYKIGKNKAQATALSLADARTYYADAHADYSLTEGPLNQTIENGTAAGTDEGDPYETITPVAESGKNTIWEYRTTTIDKNYSNVVVTVTGASDGIARPQPGTYSGISIGCTTQFAPGVYVINGDIDFGQNKQVTGSDVMFVLNNAGGIHVNSKSEIDMSGITAGTLESVYGMSSDEAAKLAGMLIFDPESTETMQYNGNSTIKMNGILYMPNRPVKLNGNSKVAGTCLMIAAGTIEFTGNNDIDSFCVPAGIAGMEVGGQELRVRLVG